MDNGRLFGKNERISFFFVLKRFKIRIRKEYGKIFKKEGMKHGR